MTASARNTDTKGFTEFSEWLRNNSALDSNKGYTATNVDFMWRDYNTKEWILLEEKRKNASVSRSQMGMFSILNSACMSDKNYKGFWILQFENLSPMDGYMTLQRIGCDTKYSPSPDELTRFLSFKKWSPPVGCISELAQLKEDIINARYG